MLRLLIPYTDEQEGYSARTRFLCWRESLSERLGNWLVDASMKIRALQAISLKRALDWGNSLVAGLSWTVYRDKSPFATVHNNFFALPLKELRSLLFT